MCCVYIGNMLINKIFLSYEYQQSAVIISREAALTAMIWMNRFWPCPSTLHEQLPYCHRFSQLDCSRFNSLNLNNIFPIMMLFVRREAFSFFFLETSRILHPIKVNNDQVAVSQHWLISAFQTIAEVHLSGMFEAWQILNRYKISFNANSRYKWSQVCKSFGRL